METTDTTENELTMLVGTYTSGTSKGIYSYRFNEEDGTATPLSETEVENPSYLVPYSYHVNADSISLFPIHSSNTNDLKTYPFEKDLNKLILSLEDTDKHAVYKPQ